MCRNTPYGKNETRNIDFQLLNHDGFWKVMEEPMKATRLFGIFVQLRTYQHLRHLNSKVAFRTARVLQRAFMLMIVLSPLPVHSQSVFDILASDAELVIFSNAFNASALRNTLTTGKQITIFVPTDSAMRDEGSAFLLESVLLAEENNSLLRQTLMHHIVLNDYSNFESITGAVQLNTLAEYCLIVDRLGTAIKVGPEAYIKKQIRAENGVIYLIDRMLIQPFDNTNYCLPGV